MISPSFSKFFGWLRTLVAILLLVSLAGVFYFILKIERHWIPPAQALSARDAFFHGTIGTELMPLPVAVVLPDLFPELFQPLRNLPNDWIDQFGFIRPSDFSDEVKLSDKDLEGLPFGWTVSNYRQKSGAPSPVKFVGFTCVMCHSTILRERDDYRGHLVIGTGNASLNFFAYLDAFQKALMSDRLTGKIVTDAYERKTGNTLDFWQKGMIDLWLIQIRKTLKDTTLKYDDGPFGGPESMWARRVPTGPGRTQPFRTLVRNLLDKPGTTMAVYTKVAPVYEQSLEQWSQVDGSIRGLRTRSAGAALAAGATPDNLAIPEISQNVIQSTQFTVHLRGPTYKDVFPDLAAKLDPAKISRGRQRYSQSCMSCHGIPSEHGSTWIRGERQDQLVNVGTDPERVSFPHRYEMTQGLYEAFPLDHPFYTDRDNIRPTSQAEVGNYINKPLPSVFSRSRFLHNASVPTIAELINLDERPAVFLCGRSLYDPHRLGFVSPAPEAISKDATPDNASPLDLVKSPDIHSYFRFDTGWRGNSNRGHDFPWGRAEALNHKDELEDLLEFMKTF